MHKSSIAQMQRYLESVDLSDLLQIGDQTPSAQPQTLPPVTRLLDVGSYDVNGNYRPLVPAGWEYTGVDITEGKNVDVVMTDEFTLPFANDCFDVVISGQCLEHCRDPHRLVRDMARVLKPGGYLFLIAPSNWPRHRFPLDCFRILPDGMTAILELAGLEQIKVQEIVIKLGSHSDCCARARMPKTVDAARAGFTFPDQGDLSRDQDGAPEIKGIKYPPDLTG